MATFDWTGSLPQTKSKIVSSQLRSRYGDVKTYLNTFNPGGAVLPDISGGTQYEALLVNSGLNGFDLTNVIRSNVALSHDDGNGSAGEVLQSDGDGTTSWVASFTENNLNGLLVGGRLTLESGVPLSTTDQTAKTSVLYTPDTYGVITLYNGSAWEVVAFTETSLTVPSTTDTNFDIFGYDNAGTFTLEAVNWTNDTTRATALARQDGVLVKSGDATRRYLGTGRTTSVSGQTQTTSASWLLYNEYNKRDIVLSANRGTTEWTYNGTTWRAAGSNTTVGATRVEAVFGSPVYVTGKVGATLEAAGTAVGGGVGIAKSATNTNDAVFKGNINVNGAESRPCFAEYGESTSAGYYYYQWVETTNGSSSVRFNNQNISGLTGQNAGLVVEMQL